MIRDHEFNPISTGGGGGGGGEGEFNPPLSGVSSITQKRERILFKLGNFFIDEWVIIFTVKIDDRPFHVAMVMAQIKGFKGDIFKKTFFLSILTAEVEAATIK